MPDMALTRQVSFKSGPVRLNSVEIMHTMNIIQDIIAPRGEVEGAH